VQAIQQHLAAGLEVYANPRAALTIHDNLQYVKDLGITLTEEPPGKSCTVHMGDVDRAALSKALALFEEKLPENIAVAVQDHGFSPQASNRLFRFRQWHDFLQRGGLLEHLAYQEPPDYLTRMRAVQQDAPGALLMDTGAAAIMGALCDPLAASWQDAGVLVVNLGNQHTVAALVAKNRVVGIYEHHTGRLSRDKLREHLEKFRQGLLGNEEVFADQGHGCLFLPEAKEMSTFSHVVVTGPRRSLAHGLGYYFAAPHGDMMLSGCFGLIRAATGSSI